MQMACIPGCQAYSHWFAYKRELCAAYPIEGEMRLVDAVRSHTGTPKLLLSPLKKYLFLLCLLGLNSNVGIRDLAVQFSCTEAVNLAAEILQSYESGLPETQRADLDLSRPLFTTAALLSACR